MILESNYYDEHGNDICDNNGNTTMISTGDGVLYDIENGNNFVKSEKNIFYDNRIQPYWKSFLFDCTLHCFNFCKKKFYFCYFFFTGQ
jgi:hypothetical protein